MKSFTAVLLLPLAVLANPLRVPESVYDSEFGIRALQATLFPHYLNPIHQATPDKASFTQYTGEAAFTATAHRNETRLLVGFDVPSDAGSRCAIKFQLPPNVPGGFQWEVTGNGKLDVWSLVKEFKNGAVTWNTKPARKTEAPQFVITQPLAGGVASLTGTVIPCLPGKRQDFEVAITRPGPGSFDWFSLDAPVHGITLNVYSP